jgi:ABC-type amino acid transport substrate-binding protein
MKHILLFAGVLCASACLGQKYTGDSWATVKAKGGTLTIVYYEQPRLIYKDVATGKMKGVCADILDDFATFVQTKYGKKLEIKYAGKEQVFPTFISITQNTANILGVTNVTITEERKKILKFTPSFMNSPLVMLTHSEAPNITSVEDIGTVMKDYSAMVIAGSTHVKIAEKIKKENAPGLKITLVNSGTEVLKELSSGSKYFSILELSEYIDATRRQLPVKRQNITLGTPEELAFIMAKQTDWDQPWNEFMTLEYRKSVRYRKIIVDNLGSNFLTLMKY